MEYERNVAQWVPGASTPAVRWNSPGRTLQYLTSAFITALTQVFDRPAALYSQRPIPFDSPP
ncbi:hypothetical protein ASPCADRAFT_206819 [Aspergillus carbonarius ITEM 5010]|uniref:Uncharacterized protein n=1 Tax=Aspergillus carbonarius (strain ITEM 5010) TaxID=602072 RepID=A0A1R3RQ71_ASPC5|nr:hypothetical protein ASPCADRAFT_206819 [Aspergillus carbonarius ITEM 5010]